MANRPKVSNKLGIPTPGDGSDGDIQVRQTNLGAKLFGKIGGRWHSTFLSGEEEIIGTSGTAISMSSSGTLSVNEIELTGKITLESRGTQNVCIGTGNADLGEDNISIGVDAGKSLDSTGLKNISIGTCAGENIAGGDGNVCIGTNTGDTITSGTINIAIGTNTLSGGTGITTGLLNTYVGYKVISYANDSQNEAVFCGGVVDGTTGKGSNTTTLGTNTTVGTYINAGTLYLKEQANAGSDTATLGQLWVKNEDPCELWFTDDAGTDTKIV